MTKKKEILSKQKSNGIKRCVSGEFILAKLEEHLKTKEHRREDLDYYLGKKLMKVMIYNNDWGASQEAGFREAMKVIAKMNLR